jgi:GNAT superfamily N-acetyltransferase
MAFEVRRANVHDALRIAAVKEAAWPGENADPERIAAVIAEADHVAQVAVLEGHIVGFVDGFITMTMDGLPRWEIDLLATHPQVQGQGVGKQLIAASVSAAREWGMLLARAFIRADNPASERAFAFCNFYPLEFNLGLYISTGISESACDLPLSTHLLTVNTFNYRGIWLEGELSPESFIAGQIVRAQYGLDTVGAVIPVDDAPCVEAAIDAGYQLVEHYRCWLLDLGEAS